MIAAVPIALTASATLVAFGAPRRRAIRWALAAPYLFLCFLSGFTVGIFFLPSAVLLILSVGVDESRASDAARASG
jgi:hypothetical protein